MMSTFHNIIQTAGGYTEPARLDKMRHRSMLKITLMFAIFKLLNFKLTKIH